MTVWRWLGSIVFVAGMLVLVGTNLSVVAQDKDKKVEVKKDETPKKDDGKKGEPKKEEVKKEEKKDAPKTDDGKITLVWKMFEPKTVTYQELTTKTNQDMEVMGQKISQKQNQTFYLKWTAEDKTKEGNFVVTQEIIGLNMNIEIGGNKIEFDSEKKQPANPMSDFFQALLGLKLKLTISPKMEVVNIEGQEDFVKKLGGTNPQMEPLLKSILSKEALQQMAEPTWGALPTKPVAKGDSWGNKDKPSKLNLGPIGTYTTIFTYTYEGIDEKTKLDKISIKSELTYSKPEQKNGLPFTIEEATLSSKDGKGFALFDRAKGRFAETSMTMDLVGDLTIDVGGMKTKVALIQHQDAQSKTMDDQPAAIAKKKQ